MVPAPRHGTIAAIVAHKIDIPGDTALDGVSRMLTTWGRECPGAPAHFIRRNVGSRTDLRRLTFSIYFFVLSAGIALAHLNVGNF
jgi:hypothetical protein